MVHNQVDFLLSFYQRSQTENLGLDQLENKNRRLLPRCAPWARKTKKVQKPPGGKGRTIRESKMLLGPQMKFKKNLKMSVRFHPVQYM